MRPTFHVAALAVALFGHAVTSTASAATSPAPTASQQLATLFDEYWEKALELDPVAATSIGDPRYNDRFVVDIAPEVIAEDQRVQRDFLERIRKVDRTTLTPQEQLSYDIFTTDRERDIEGFRFPRELIPLNQFYSTPNLFAQLGSGKGIQPFKTVKDYDDFLSRLDGLVRWTDQAIANMRIGMTRGYTLPKVLVERTLPQLQAHVVAKPEESLYWGPVSSMPASFAAADRERLTAAYRAAIEAKVVPTYRRLHDFMRDEYLPKARTTDGMTGLPDGAAWYAYLVKRTTTTNYTPEQIHQIGLDEVARIQAAMDGIMREVGFKGTRAEFFGHLKTDPKFFWSSADELIAVYVKTRNKVDPLLPKLFETLPKADYEVRAVEPFREKSASAGSYEAASEDGSRPGVFYANTYDLRARPKRAMEALSLHEGNPGHHLQISIQREQQGLPKFRRFGGFTAYTEGWGLYSESAPIGRALGCYEDPYMYFGQLEAELWRSIRLVADTGLHAKGWTREQVLAYATQNSAEAEARKVSETERFMAIPSQALAYKIGQLKISELRARAERALGAKFDVRKFHTAVLNDGALPLGVLEAKIDRWIETQR
jgi:uncharacterized protein (DUF885 family)